MEKQQSDMKISQSLMKAYEAYVFGNECGLVIKDQYIDGNYYTPDDPDDPRNMGTWFEFQCTGALPKSGKIIEPERLASGANKGDLKAKYRVLQDQHHVYLNIMKSYGFQIVEVNKTIVSGDLSGVVDIVAKKDGKICFIDLKTTGNINDKWSDYGWDEIEDKPAATIQAVHYKVLGMLTYDQEPDFYFMVFSTVKATDAKIYKVEVDKDRFTKHIEKIKFIKQQLLSEPLEARPDYNRCGSCVLADKYKCEYKITVPEIRTVYVG